MVEEEEEEEEEEEIEEEWIAERSASRGEEGGGEGTTRVRPSNPIEWSLCLSQHLQQMRLWTMTLSLESSCSVRTSAGGSG